MIGAPIIGGDSSYKTLFCKPPTRGGGGGGGVAGETHYRVEPRLPLNYLDKKSMYIGLYKTPNKVLSCLYP